MDCKNLSGSLYDFSVHLQPPNFQFFQLHMLKSIKGLGDIVQLFYTVNHVQPRACHRFFPWSFCKRSVTKSFASKWLQRWVTSRKQAGSSQLESTKVYSSFFIGTFVPLSPAQSLLVTLKITLMEWNDVFRKQVDVGSAKCVNSPSHHFCPRDLHGNSYQSWVFQPLFERKHSCAIHPPRVQEGSHQCNPSRVRQFAPQRLSHRLADLSEAKAADLSC